MTRAAAPIPYRSGLCVHGRHDRCRGVWGAAVCDCACHQQQEPEPVTVHCFFGCEHVARDEDPLAAHDAMEAHYRAAHWQRIREHLSVSLQRSGRFLALTAPLEAAAVRLLSGVGGEREWWLFNPAAGVGHLRVNVTPGGVRGDPARLRGV